MSPSPSSILLLLCLVAAAHAVSSRQKYVQFMSTRVFNSFPPLHMGKVSDEMVLRRCEGDTTRAIFNDIMKIFVRNIPPRNVVEMLGMTRSANECLGTCDSSLDKVLNQLKPEFAEGMADIFDKISTRAEQLSSEGVACSEQLEQLYQAALPSLNRDLITGMFVRMKSVMNGCKWECVKKTMQPIIRFDMYKEFL